FKSLIENFIRENMPLWFITGENTMITGFNNMNRTLDLRPLRNQSDNIFPAFNQNFSLFNISEETREIISGLPPVLVPFGEYSLKSEAEVILFQQVGKIVTSKPLLMLNKNQSIKEAILTGTGVWQWRLNEYMENESFDGFDDLISKIVQYLSSKEDKRKFRVYPVKNEFWDNEPVIFETEIYNDIFEKIHGQKIDLTIRDENDSSQSYSYVISPANTRFRISGLQPGVYRYTARSNVNGENVSATGMFSIKKMQVELTNITADHQLLKELSRRSGGQYFDYSRISELRERIQGSDVNSMIISSENYLAIINMKWIFFVLLLLFTIEWGFRKYLGGY
ncbi:MAG: VWA domain-containing protein, partial [Cyclobacteriaceae bacterium]|nr:VWA domain-containing protein [Cyclobacteriaceae bacterium]